MLSFNSFKKRSTLKRRNARRITEAASPTAAEIEQLEDRVLLVIGAFDVPAAVGVGEGYDGIAQLGLATGTLLSTHRHVLTAAHVASQGSTANSRFVVEGPNGPVSISTPGLGMEQHPFYPFEDGGFDEWDIGVMVLAELGPLTAEGWGIYTDDDEYRKLGNLVGYGGTGTGTMGHSTDIKTDQYWNTDTGQETNYELVRFTITGNPTGGVLFPATF